MNIKIALIHGLIWSIMWGGSITIMEIKWPHIMLHDYPKEIQEVINLPPLKDKKAGIMFELFSMFFILAFIFWSGIDTYSLNSVSYLIILGHIFIVAMSWNICDLFVMDWLIFCFWQPSFIVLPGSEGHKAYKNYKFHFIGFLKGCGITAIGSIAIAGVCFGILKYLIW